MKALLAAALFACGPDPDMVLSDRVSVHTNGFPVDEARLWRAMRIIHDAATRVCPQPAWCAEIFWRPDPFFCANGGEKVHGCQPYPPHCLFEVGFKAELADTALVDEIGHYVWQGCFGRSGEHGSGVYDQDFYAFTQGIRNEIRHATNGH